MNEVKRQINGSTLAMLLLAGPAIALLFGGPTLWGVGVLVGVIALVPWVFSLMTTRQVGEAAPDDSAEVSRIVFGYTFMAVIPLLGILIAENMRDGKVGGGSTTVNGHTSYSPVYPVGDELGTALCLRQLVFGLAFTGWIAALVSTIL